MPVRRGGGTDARFSDVYGSSQTIATPTGLNDAGVFDVSLRDERYLPFERCGAISAWRIQLPFSSPAGVGAGSSIFRPFDYRALIDVIVTLGGTGFVFADGVDVEGRDGDGASRSHHRRAWRYGRLAEQLVRARPELELGAGVLALNDGVCPGGWAGRRWSRNGSDPSCRTPPNSTKSNIENRSVDLPKTDSEKASLSEMDAFHAPAARKLKFNKRYPKACLN